MHKTIFLLTFLLATFLCLPPRAKAQTEEIQQLLLNVEKLNQLKSILSDMKSGYDIISQGYGTIKDISEGSFNLHAHFLDGLLAVNPTVQHYKRVAEIVTLQQRIVSEYKAAYSRFRQDGNFSPSELDYLARVYAHLFDESLRHLDELVLILTAGELRMSDDERLEAIDRIFTGTAEKLTFLRHFNRQATLLAIQRAKERNDVQTLQNLYLDFTR
ncbi:TerB family tellurite resistance protein [Pontibacter sp. MBLB2868]|uniref:tellurite resistance TerB family protein n=1 Tax=Pontibacter sp. MBLB2868 TaxID=3451555 RepID=UPI003F75353D